MENSRKIFILTEIVLAVALVLTAAAMLRERNGQERERVSVILPEPDASRWAAMKYGMLAAAEEWGIEVRFTTAEAYGGSKELKSIIKNEKDNGADAVVLLPAPGIEAKDLTKKIAGNIPVIFAGRASDPEDQGFPMAGADDYAMGAALAGKMAEDYGEGLNGKTVGVLSEKTEAAQERYRGIEDALKEQGAVIAWYLTDDLDEEEKDIFEEQSAVDFIAALDDSSLVTAGGASESHILHEAAVYGIANSTEAVYYLDIGSVSALVVPDDFDIGYHCINEIAKRLDNIFYRMKGKTVSYTVLCRETLFLKENQELLFTLSQKR